MADVLTELPPGFVLDQPQGLPPGFILDEPAISITGDTGRRTPEGRRILTNNQGGLSTELTVTIPAPGGGFMVVPSIFNGQIVSEDQAATIINQNNGVDPETGRQVPVFPTIQEANQAAQVRSDSLLGEEQQDELSAATIDANEILDLDPRIVERGTILPLGRTAEGDLEFAVPQIALDVARAIILPGQALRGVPITEREVIEAGFEMTGPAARGVKALRTATKAGKLSAQQIADAPTALDLTKASGKKFTAARQSGASLKADDFVGFLAGAERDILEEGADSVLHPKLTAVFNALTKKIGSEMSARDLHNVRRTIGIATQSAEPDEARIARVLRNNFDDFVENLPGTEEWIKARNLYIKARKAETVETAINKAGNAASGLENGLRIEFRKILNDPRKTRNFSKQEKDAMQKVVDGDFTANTLKKIGRLSFGSGQQSGFLGGSIGVGTGAALGGPAGAVLAPVAGFAASKGAEKRTLRAANIVRALIGGARPEIIPGKTIDPTLIRTLAGPLAVTSGE